MVKMGFYYENMGRRNQKPEMNALADTAYE